MTITILKSKVESTQSVTTTLSATLNSVTGTDVVIVVCASARATNTTFSISGITWDGNTMTVARNEQADLNGFPRGIAQIAYLAIGNPSGLTANAVMTVTSTLTAMGLTVFALQGVDQTTPLKDNDGTSVVTAASSASRNVTTAIEDIVIDCLTCAAQITASPGSGQVQVANENATSPTSTHAVSYKLPPDAGNTTMSQSWTNSSFTYAVASFRESGFAPGGSPTITSVVGVRGATPPAIIDVTDRDMAVNGTDILGGISTKLYYADDSVFATANKVLQSIDSVTSTTMNWVEPNLGEIGRGPGRFLFVVADEGEISEDVSVGFAVQVEAFVGGSATARRVYETTGTGNISVVTDLPFVPRGAIIQAVDTGAPDSLDAPALLTVCFVGPNDSGGICIISSTSPAISRRRHTLGTGSLIIVSNSSSSGTDQVTGTPSLTATGMDINFTNAVAGKELYITFFAFECHLTQFAINSSPVTGVPFQPNVLFGITNCASSTNDTSFSVLSFGIVADGTECHTSASYGGFSTRNCVNREGEFLVQINTSGTGFDWSMTGVTFTGDGYSWSGSNADLAYGLAMDTAGASVFLGSFDTTSNGTNGLTEDFVDVGFDPDLICVMTATRVGTSFASTLGGRWSVGWVDGALAHHSTYSHHLQATGTGTARNQQSNSLLCMGSTATTVLEFTADLPVFGQVGEIRYPEKIASALHMCVFAVAGGDEIALDQDAAHVSTLNYEVTS